MMIFVERTKPLEKKNVATIMPGFFAGGNRMKLLYKHNDEVMTEIETDDVNRTVKIVNHTDQIIDRAFGAVENPTYELFLDFLEDRCFPRTRDGMKLHLRELGLDAYDPVEICKKTNGRLHDR
jgi:putative transcriptional regulator